VQGIKGDSGAKGASGTSGVYVLSGYLTSGGLNTAGYWTVTNIYSTYAPLISVYVRASTAQVWWTPPYYVTSLGDIRILNNQSTGVVAATNLTGYEYRIVVMQQYQ
jgi:hypothetical protein